jgi:prepilin-type N-terminal cleavage/methylation domain-containing protein
MRKKGFTFVELAIVLVIIGIIMGMLIKGRALIETARLKNEIRKIERIQTGVAGWFAKTTGGIEAVNAFPLLNNADPTTLDFNEVPDLSAAEMANPYDNWELRRGKFAAGAVTADPNEAGINIYIRTETTTPRFACNIEFMLDDRNFASGNGRSQVDPSPYLTTGADPEFTPCDNWTELIENSIFDYRIF